jgi:hypothetical protein
MTGAPLYVYGIMAAPGLVPAGLGIAGAGMELVSDAGLSALVSQGVEQPVPRMRRHLLVHAKVLEQVMANITVLPVRFGTVAPSRAALAACMRRHESAFRAEMAHIDGRVEVGVKASWREAGLFADILEQDAALRQLRDSLQHRAPGETYYDRIELGRRVEATLAERGKECAAAIAAALSPLAERETELPPQEDCMILNRAFLLPRAREAAFDAAVERVAQHFGNKLNLRYVGPVPPFNFVSLYANWLGGEGA